MKKKLSAQEKAVGKIILWQDVCHKSYDGEHVWAEGQLFKQLDIFGILIPFKKMTLKLNLCRACGTIKRKEQYA